MEVKTWIIIGVAVLIALAVGMSLYGFVTGTYNKIQSADIAVETAQGYVESAYQMRADKIPEMIGTVQGSADFEKSTLVELAAMRSQAGMIQQKMRDANSIDEMQNIEDTEIQGVGGILARLMMVVEAYPSIRSTDAFANLQSTIEGTENRIKRERDIYNDRVSDYKNLVRKFPELLVANYFGYSESKWQMYKARAGSDVAPIVTFKF